MSSRRSRWPNAEYMRRLILVYLSFAIAAGLLALAVILTVKSPWVLAGMLVAFGLGWLAGGRSEFRGRVVDIVQHLFDQQPA